MFWITREPSSCIYMQCLAKITEMVLSRVFRVMFAVYMKSIVRFHFLGHLLVVFGIYV